MGWRHWGAFPTAGPELCILSSPGGPLLPRAHLPGPTLPLLPQSSSFIPPSLCSSPASLDAFVFSYLALLLQAKLPSGKLQAHLQGLHNLCSYCTHILSLYFPWDGGTGGWVGGGCQLWGNRAGIQEPSFLALS